MKITITLEKEENNKIMAAHMMDSYAAFNPLFLENSQWQGEMFMIHCGGEKIKSKTAHMLIVWHQLFPMYTQGIHTYIEAWK